MTKQVQIRGAVQATQEARTLASRELDVNTTDSRICIHDGSTAGGVPHINYKDHQNQEYTYAAASGTDTITITLAKAPAAYQAGQKFVFKAANTNTASATLNVNSLGAKTIKKKDTGSGTISALSAGDIIQGGIYAVYYDGTDMILESVDSASGTWTYNSVSVTSAATIEIATGLSGIKEIEIFFNSVSTVSSATVYIQLGDSGGYETSSYYGGYAAIDGTETAGSHVTAGFVVLEPANSAASFGVAKLHLADNSSTWVLDSHMSQETRLISSAGLKALSSTITQIRVGSSSGNFYAAGTIYIRYR